MKEVIIYTDGACLGNPGRGGYGAVIIYKAARKEISQGYALTTNNRMEIMAAIAALEALKEACRVKLYSDSKYLVDAIKKGWLDKWRANNFMRNKKEAALNRDLWERLIIQQNRHDIEFIWVKGHAGNDENERCDILAVNAAKGEGLLNDFGYHTG